MGSFGQQRGCAEMAARWEGVVLHRSSRQLDGGGCQYVRQDNSTRRSSSPLSCCRTSRSARSLRADGKEFLINGGNVKEEKREIRKQCIEKIGNTQIDRNKVFRCDA